MILRTGIVSIFDDDLGWGAVTPLGLVESPRLLPAGERIPFHITALADSTRTIGVGDTVSFRCAPGRAGRWEAVSVQPV